MRQLTITIYARANTNDKAYSFNSQRSTADLNAITQPDDVSNVYQLVYASLNYSIQSSNVLSNLVLSMNQTKTVATELKSGQYIQITDNGKIVFEGTLYSCIYKLMPPSDSNAGGWYLNATLAPSIFQLSLLPMLYDSNQKTQIDGLLGINTANILVGEIAQSIKTSTLLDYMVTNTDFYDFFKKTISYFDLPNNVFLMAEAGQTRDSVLRASLNYTNTVFYQQENGGLIIRLLDANNKAPFQLDLSNQTQTAGFASILSGEYSDNAASVAAVISNYSILTPNLGVAANPQSNFISYKPNPKYYPRIQELQNAGWFTAMINHTPINSNIVSDPTTRAVFEGFKSLPDKYVISSQQYGAKDDFFADYQSLLTGQEMGQALTGYAGLEAIISLDDIYLPANGMNKILGTCVNILNCSMPAGIIATYNRSYSAAGSLLNLNICPLGSMTGAWK